MVSLLTIKKKNIYILYFVSLVQEVSVYLCIHVYSIPLIKYKTINTAFFLSSRIVCIHMYAWFDC